MTSRILCQAEAAGLQGKPGVFQPLTLGHGSPRAAGERPLWFTERLTGPSKTAGTRPGRAMWIPEPSQGRHGTSLGGGVRPSSSSSTDSARSPDVDLAGFEASTSHNSKFATQTDTGPEATGSVSGSADTHLQVGTAPTTTGFRSDLSCTIKQSNHTNILASLTHNTMANNDNQNEVSTGDDDYRSIEAEDSTTTSLATAVEEQLLTSPTKTSSDSGRITPVFPEGERIIDALGTGAEDSGPHVPDVEESSTAGSGVSVIRRTLEGLGRTRTPISCSQMVDRLRGEHRAGNRSRRNSDRSSQLNAARGVDNSDLGDDGDLPASQGSPFRSAAGHFAPSDSPYLITNCSNDDDEDPSSTSQTQPPADLHLQSGEAGRGGESSLKRSPEEQAPASGLEEEVGAGVKKGRKKRRGKSRSKNNNNDNTNNNNNDEGDADAPLPTPAEVYGSHESKLTLTVHRKGADSGAMDVVARQLFMVPEHIRVTAILPRPDGAIVEVADSSSAETVRAALSNQGWTVDIDQIWARYEFTVPAQLAGTNPNHSGLDAITLETN
ncbi:hypothetical protein ACHWQZ_G000845 [Mnemiopsis leidyi]